MKSFTAFLKITAVPVHTLVCYLAYFVVYLCLRLFRVSADPWRNRLLRAWSSGMAFIFNMKIETDGNPPPAPFYLVSNHISYMDIVVLYNTLNGTFVAKKEVRAMPIIGFMAFTLGIIFIDRNRKRDVTRVNKQQSLSLNRDRGVILFPEGKTSDGSQILPLRSPLLEFPAKEGIPVHYATIYYETGKGDVPAGESVCWHDEIPLHKHMFRMAKCSSIRCKVTFGVEAVKNKDRKELAATLGQLMNRQFEPVAGKNRV